MKIATITFLYGKSRLQLVLHNYLVSLRQWQTVTPDESWLAVEPTGPDDDTPEVARKMCEPFGMQVIRVEPKPTDKYWNKCRALNHAIRATSPEIDIIMQVDVDMILHPRHIEKALQSFAGEKKALYLCPNRSLTHEVIISEKEPLAQWERLHKVAQYVPTGEELENPRMSNPDGIGPPSKSWGVCQAAQRKWWFYIRGYDEFINGWGSDDADIVRRAGITKRPKVWAPEDLLCFHQQHPRRNDNVTEEEKLKRGARARKNRRRSFEAYYLKQFKRNLGGWGGIPKP